MSKILYLKMKLITKSPLIIGSGLDDNTDSDILIGGDSLPYIPGTTLSGVCRHYLDILINTNDVFGYKNNGKDDSKQSSIIFYDATLNNEYQITTRDGVKLKNGKTTENGGKYDYEIIEEGSSFDFRLELKTEEDDFNLIIDNIINGFNISEIRIGGKTNRGFGKVQTADEKYLLIDLETELAKYINFQWEDVKDEYIINPIVNNQYETLVLTFSLNSFLFIRTFVTTAIDESNNNKIVDAEQLLNASSKPVIPGTTWAGTFRHHFEKILKNVGYENTDTFIKDVFGYVEGKERAISKIIFSESVIQGSHQLNKTRNAIDRFTGGAGDKKLFTSRPTYKGTGKLEVKIKKDIANVELIKSIINTCIDDMNEGFLAVGGEISTGGGLLKVKKEGGEIKWK